MTPAPRSSFAVKITLLITAVSGVATGLVCTALLALQVRHTLAAAAETAGAQARIIAANSTAALDFDDADAARSTLAGLAAVPEFAAAQITRTGGEVFSRYERGGAGTLPPLGSAALPGVHGRWLTVSQPIARDREVIGTLTLHYDLAPSRRRLARDAAIAVGVTAGVIALSFLAARRLQRSLLRPVRELARAAAAITSTDDYAIRARKYSHDELGTLTDVFNGMVAQIGAAEVLRRDHQAALQREVAQRTAEVLESQARLRQSERMAALGTLSAGLGHDIGNILMPLRSHLSSIREAVTSAEPGTQEHFEAVTKATEYLQNLSTGLRALAQSPDQDAARQEATSLAGWWTATEPLLRAVVGGRIALEHDLPGDLPPVLISRSLLTQAVFNLVQNAAQAMSPERDAAPPTGARIRVSARTENGDGAARVRLAVSDNGPGMSEEVQRRCIEPYFTTKTRRISSGLGLALVKGIIEGAGGTLEIESAVGEGSTFAMRLPASAATAPPDVVLTIAESRRRAVVSHVLTSLGCRVRVGPPAGEPAAAGETQSGWWVTDSLGSIPGVWRGRVIVLGSVPDGAGSDGAVVLDPATPVPALRKALRGVLVGAHDD